MKRGLYLFCGMAGSAEISTGIRDCTKIFVGMRDFTSSAGAGLLKITWRDAGI